MPTIVERYGLAYFGVPKVASSSMKRVIFALEHSETYLDDGWKEAGQPGPLHALYPSEPLRRSDFRQTQRHWKFAVVRDPIDRLLSAYGHRVLGVHDLERSPSAARRARLLRISLRPDLDEFCLRLNRYRLMSSVLRHHIAPQVRFLGRNPAQFDAIYPIEQMSRLADDISTRTGKTISIPFSSGDGPRFLRTACSDAALDATKHNFAADFRFLKGIYPTGPQS